jgi:carboxymethylenebutenolidase
MPEYVTFPSEGSTAAGYLARPPKKTGPGVLVIQEWWGLDPGIKEMCDRLALGGFTALAPDLYRGEVALHHEMDRAAELMKKLPPERAARDMSAAIDYLLSHQAVTSKGVGVVGFCMGGMLSFHIAANRPDKVQAVVAFYGFPQGGNEPDWSKLRAKVRGHMAENDSFFPPDKALALEKKLQALGKDVEFTVYPGTGHAFMGPHNALGTLDTQASELIWPGVIQFLRDNVS